MKIMAQHSVDRLTDRFTLDVTASTLFGLDVDSQKNPDNVLVENGRKLFTEFGYTNPIILSAGK